MTLSGHRVPRSTFTMIYQVFTTLDPLWFQKINQFVITFILSLCRLPHLIRLKAFQKISVFWIPSFFEVRNMKVCRKKCILYHIKLEKRISKILVSHLNTAPRRSYISCSRQLATQSSVTSPKRLFAKIAIRFQLREMQSKRVTWPKTRHLAKKAPLCQKASLFKRNIVSPKKRRIAGRASVCKETFLATWRFLTKLRILKAEELWPLWRSEALAKWSSWFLSTKYHDNGGLFHLQF